jgi:hypothetical protein
MRITHAETLTADTGLDLDRESLDRLLRSDFDELERLGISKWSKGVNRQLEC